MEHLTGNQLQKARLLALQRALTRWASFTIVNPCCWPSNKSPMDIVKDEFGFKGRNIPKIQEQLQVVIDSMSDAP